MVVLRKTVLRTDGYLKGVKIVPLNKIKQEDDCKRELAVSTNQLIEVNFNLTNYKVICNGNKTMGFVGKVNIKNARILKKIKIIKNNCNFMNI